MTVKQPIHSLHSSAHYTSAPEPTSALPKVWGRNELLGRMGSMWQNDFFVTPTSSCLGANAVLLILKDFDERTGSRKFIEDVRSPSQLELVPDPSSDLLEIRNSFGLSITATARVLRVERPTIYAWLKSTSTPSVANRRRLRTIASLATTWGTSGANTPPDLSAPLADGMSLMELLVEEHLRTVTISQSLTQVAAQQRERPRRRRSLTQVAADRGIRTSGEDIDAYTGRPLGPPD